MFPQRGEHPPRSGPEIEVPPEDVGDGRAAEDRVREPVTDVRHALEHDVDAHEPTQGAPEQSGLQPMAEELVRERFREPIHHRDSTSLCS